MEINLFQKCIVIYTFEKIQGAKMNKNYINYLQRPKAAKRGGVKEEAAASKNIYII